MKNLIVVLSLITQFSITPVRAAEVSVAGVGGMVATMGIVGVVLSVGMITGNGGLLKSEQLDEALDVVALGDTSFMSYELEAAIDELKTRAPELSDYSDLEILEAIIKAEEQAEL